MISCVIIDDEKPARETLSLMLERYFSDKVEIVGTAGSLKKGVLSIYENKPDIVFLDIEMPNEDGFKIFNYFQEVDFSIVFTTAYKEYSIKAIKVAALNYILKPINVNELRETIKLFEKRKITTASKENIEKLLSNLDTQHQSLEKVALPTFTGFKLERINSIIYCESNHNYTNFYLNNGETLLVSKPLNVIQNMLPKQVFYRIHKSYLINMNFIKEFSRVDGYHVILDNDTRLDVANRRKEEFIKVLTNRQTIEQ